jgi:hypothetical protein
MESPANAVPRGVGKLIFLPDCSWGNQESVKDLGPLPSTHVKVHALCFQLPELTVAQILENFCFRFWKTSSPISGEIPEIHNS